MIRSAQEPITLNTPRERDNRKNYKTWKQTSRTHTHKMLPESLRVQPLRMMRSEVCFKWQAELRAQQQQEQSIGRLSSFCVSSSLGFLFWVPLLLQPLGIALSHGVDDRNDKVADHHQHHLLKHPRQPVVILETQDDARLQLLRQNASWGGGILNVGHPESCDDCFRRNTSTHTSVLSRWADVTAHTGTHKEWWSLPLGHFLQHGAACSSGLQGTGWRASAGMDPPWAQTWHTRQQRSHSTHPLPNRGWSSYSWWAEQRWELGLPNIPVTASEGHTVEALVLNLPPPQTRNWANWVKQQLLNPPFILHCPL